MDVKNAVIGPQQARARYETAVAARALAQQTLEAERGTASASVNRQLRRWCKWSATWQPIKAPRSQSMANYTHAKVAFDEAVGQTLDVNGSLHGRKPQGRHRRERVGDSCVRL